MEIDNLDYSIILFLKTNNPLTNDKKTNSL